MATCKEIHRLVSEGLDRDLSVIERTKMRLHLLICDACTNFSGQMQLIRKAMHKMAQLDEPDATPDPESDRARGPERR
ncbi:zf-HC2 domain-containing protein [Undibacterium arcticum]|uniref:Zf-HC2 domain-containing protein n=1 Tax=Undibacterium arcticum TaxID=1762892 RepID=A0ABV7EYP4_9BURK